VQDLLLDYVCGNAKGINNTLEFSNFNKKGFSDYLKHGGNKREMCLVEKSRSFCEHCNAYLRSK
jgi:hypothetical protein